jgi:hypothetical protein
MLAGCQHRKQHPKQEGGVRKRAIVVVYLRQLIPPPLSWPNYVHFPLYSIDPQKQQQLFSLLRSSACGPCAARCGISLYVAAETQPPNTQEPLSGAHCTCATSFWCGSKNGRWERAVKACGRMPFNAAVLWPSFLQIADVYPLLAYRLLTCRPCRSCRPLTCVSMPISDGSS